tara:strand:- start:1906 stop:2496 length:591 start_codon:yes stop_codon:yes gene_type:complete
MYKHTQSGFSLVETLVAITILLIVIVGPMTISVSTSRSTSFSSEQVVAFFLAQEGIEATQKARDDLILNAFLPSSDGNYSATPWSTFSDSVTGPYANCYSSAGCGMEMTNSGGGVVSSPVVCTGSSCRMYYDSTRDIARYNLDTLGTVTPYSRNVRFVELSPNEIRVISTVQWRTGSQRNFQEVQLETSLFNVYGN